MAALEAMACGRASVVTAIPAIDDIHVAGEPAIVVAPEDVDAFAAAVNQLANVPERRDRMGQAARTRVKHLFSLDQEAKRYQEFYGELLPGALDRGVQPLNSVTQRTGETIYQGIA